MNGKWGQKLGDYNFLFVCLFDCEEKMEWILVGLGCFFSKPTKNQPPNLGGKHRRKHGHKDQGKFNRYNMLF